MAKPFSGEIKLDIRDSTPDWSAFLPDRAPESAPNVLVVLYDDTGLAAWSPFGGRIEMPTMQRLADEFRALEYTIAVPESGVHASAAIRCSSKTANSPTSATSSASLPEQKIVADAPTSGTHIVGVDFTKERAGEYHEPHGPMKLYVDDQVVGQQEMRTILSRYSLCGEGLCIGYDGGMPSRASTRPSSRSPAAGSSRSSSTSPMTHTSTSNGS